MYIIHDPCDLFQRVFIS